MFQLNGLARTQQLYYEQLFQNSSDAMILLNDEHRIIAVNPAFCTLFLYRPDEAAGSDLDELVVPDSFRQEALRVTDEVLSGRVIQKVTRRCRKDGKPVPLETCPRRVAR